MPKHPAYPLLRAAARALKLPLSFPTDLTKHDRAILAAVPDTECPFAWAVYSNGTHLCWEAKVVTSVAGTFEGLHWHVWTGRELLPCRNATEARERLTDLSWIFLRGPMRTMDKPLQWHVGGDVFACAVEPGACPFCYALGAVVELPPPLRAVQPDGTTHVCHPALGGCNHGFAKEEGG